MNDSWLSGNPYERFMGRWSNLIAEQFLDWLAIPANRTWLDIGCGTGVLTRLILEQHHPAQVIALDSSTEFIGHAQQTIKHSSARFMIGLAQSLKIDTDAADVAVSGLMLNFVPDPEIVISEMMRVIKPSGTIGIFLWDYAGKMEMLRYFWDAAVELNEKAKQFDEGLRFPLCQDGALKNLVRSAGLKEVKARAIEATTRFKSFDDYWEPFLGNVGPAPSYVRSLSQTQKLQLEERLRQSLPISEDGSISLIARAWAMKGTV